MKLALVTLSKPMGRREASTSTRAQSRWDWSAWFSAWRYVSRPEVHRTEPKSRGKAMALAKRARSTCSSKLGCGGPRWKAWSLPAMMDCRYCSCSCKAAIQRAESIGDGCWTKGCSSAETAIASGSSVQVSLWLSGEAHRRGLSMDGDRYHLLGDRT
jgi:hypothetical protein